MTDHIVFWGLCAVLVFVPLPIGSVREWAVFVFEAATIGLFLLHLVGGGQRREGRAGGAKSPEGVLPRFVKVGIGVFLALSILQIVPLPEAVVEVLSPRAHAVYAGLAQDGIAAPPSWMTLSLAPAASVSELILVICYGLFGFLVLRAVRTRRRAEILVLVVLASALFQAFYGMAEVFSGHETIFGRPKRFGIGSVTGTYVNRNHFAGFLEMAFPLSLGYLLVKARYFAMEKGMSLRRRIVWFGQESLQWTLLLGLVPVFIGLGIVFSKSRSGIMVFAVTAVLAAAAATSWRKLSDEDGDGGEGEGGREGGRRRSGRIVHIVVAVVLAAAVWLGIGPVVKRFAEVDISSESRRVFYANTLEMIGDFPWSGTGKGTFVNAYPIYEKIDDRLRLSFAHNDYLELAAENGVPAAVALIVAGIGLVVWLAALWRRRRDPFAKGIGLGAGLGVAALFIHGFTDFNLQITANAVYFTALAMLGAAVLRNKKDGDTYPGYVSPGKAPAKGILKPTLKAALGVILAVALFVPAAKDFLGFRHLEAYRRIRREARSVESAFPGLEARLSKAASASPLAVFDVELARLYVEMARVANDSGRDEERDALCDKAVARYARAIAANPIDAATRYETGTTYLLYNFPLMTYQDRASSHFRRALELKPADETINLNVLFLYFSWWPGLEDADKAYGADVYRKMAARDPGFPARLEARWKQSYGTAERLDAVLAELPR